MKLKTKLNGAFLVVTVVLTVVITGVSSYFLANEIVLSMEGAARNQVDQLDFTTSNFIEQNSQLMLGIANFAELKAGLGRLSQYMQTKQATRPDPGKYSLSEKKIAEIFANLRLAYDHIEQIEFGDDTGGYVMDPPKEKPAGYDPRQRPWYKADLEKGDRWTRLEARKTSGAIWSLVWRPRLWAKTA